MASELGNQLLARVQTEMARNIATIKRQLIEWLERPESGGVDALRESMAEISGGLSLMEQEEAVALAEAISMPPCSLHPTAVSSLRQSLMSR